ncbi:unnamed protein product [Phytophthora fragariaefolia]|uniref:Unnamed protein product n=1 Tax=Phytophthora fragariaefolia TaxID=1490495 RepID=A0A9W6XML2_9STRA|nr:unnamed protein product [Phytophthora fragariaefolia]
MSDRKSERQRTQDDRDQRRTKDGGPVDLLAVPRRAILAQLDQSTVRNHHALDVAQEAVIDVDGAVTLNEPSEAGDEKDQNAGEGNKDDELGKLISQYGGS